MMAVTSHHSPLTRDHECEHEGWYERILGSRYGR